MFRKTRALKFCLLALGVLLLLLSPALLSAETLPKANRIPTPPTPPQGSLIRQGVALHDAGDYEGAIARYERVLAESPGVVEAMYEAAFSYVSNMNCAKAMTLAREGAQYKSSLLPRFHMLLGNCLDDLGKGDEAIDLYKDAIKLTPDFALLHYNLGFAYLRARKTKEARQELQQSLYLNPNHATSHYLLATIYQELGYRVPAVMGLSTFLLIEPDSQRSIEALDRLNSLIGFGVQKSDKTGQINIQLSARSETLKDEGDFGPVELAVALSLAGAQIADGSKEVDLFRQLSASYSAMSVSLSGIKPKGFASSYYAPFFAELNNRDFAEAFVYRMFSSTSLKGSGDWARENRERMVDFQRWVQAYPWPDKK